MDIINGVVKETEVFFKKLLKVLPCQPVLGHRQLCASVCTSLPIMGNAI